MANHTVKKQPKSTVFITLRVPWAEIQEEYKKAFKTLHESFEMGGFRKGKVPTELAEKNIPKDKIYSQLIHTLMPKLYEDIVKKEGLQPILAPKIELVKAKENEEWEIGITVAQRPEIKLKDYKKKVKEAKEKIAKPEIWVPGKDQKPQEADKEKQKDKLLQAGLEALLTEAECEIPPLLIEEELNKRLTQTVDDIQKIGLTVDGYLKSKNMTMDQLKERLSREIADMYRLEFILQTIADEEKLQVEQKELDTLFANIKDEKERAAVQKNAYFYASVLRKQKSLDYIIGL